MTLAIPTFRHLRNAVIALVIALTITLAPIVRADTIKFVRSVFGFADIGARQPAAVVKADLTH